MTVRTARRKLLTRDWMTVSSRSLITPYAAFAVTRRIGAVVATEGFFTSESDASIHSGAPAIGAVSSTHDRTNPSLSATTLAAVAPTTTSTSACGAGWARIR